MTIGFDGSSIAGLPNTSELAAQGHAFGIPRLNFGHVRDPLGAKYLERIRGAGMNGSSGYSYVRSWEDGASQARFAVGLARELGCSFLWPDFEPAKSQRADGSWPIPTDAPHLARPVMLAWLEQALDLGLPIGIYGGPWYLGMLDLPAWVGSLPLFVSHYGVTKPSVPKPWTGWTIWQHTPNVKRAGALVDLNETPLSREQLDALLGGEPMPEAWTPGTYHPIADDVVWTRQVMCLGCDAEEYESRDEGPVITPQNGA